MRTNKEEDQMSTVAMDHMYMGAKGETDLIPILVAKDSKTKTLITLPTRHKGVQDE